MKLSEMTPRQNTKKEYTYKRLPNGAFDIPGALVVDGEEIGVNTFCLHCECEFFEYTDTLTPGYCGSHCYSAGSVLRQE